MSLNLPKKQQFFSSISALASKKRSNKKNKVTLYHKLEDFILSISHFFWNQLTFRFAKNLMSNLWFEYSSIGVFNALPKLQLFHQGSFYSKIPLIFSISLLKVNWNVKSNTLSLHSIFSIRLTHCFFNKLKFVHFISAGNWLTECVHQLTSHLSEKIMRQSQ